MTMTKEFRNDDKSQCNGDKVQLATLQRLCLCVHTFFSCMLLVPHNYSCLYLLFLRWYLPLCPCLYLCIAGITPESLSIRTVTVITVGRLVQATLSLYLALCLCAYMLLVPHWYCFLYVLVLLVHWYQPLYVSVPICYWYHTGTALYMYWYCWYCWYCWYTGTNHSMSLCLYVPGTTLVLLFICTGTVGTVGTLVPATLCLCAYMLHWYTHWYCSLCVLVLLVLLVHWYQPLYVSVPICYWYHTSTAVYMYWYCWYCWYCWYTGTSNSMSLCLYVSGTTLALLFICAGTVGTFGTLVPATLCLFLYGCVSLRLCGCVSLYLCACVAVVFLCLCGCCLCACVAVVSLCLCDCVAVCLFCGFVFSMSIFTSCAFPSVYVYILLLCK